MSMTLLSYGALAACQYSCIQLANSQLMLIAYVGVAGLAWSRMAAVMAGICAAVSVASAAYQWHQWRNGNKAANGVCGVAVYVALSSSLAGNVNE